MIKCLAMQVIIYYVYDLTLKQNDFIIKKVNERMIIT